MRKFRLGFIYFLSAVFLTLALSAPASSPAASMHAALLESIQQQINELIAAVARIQARINEILAERAHLSVVVPPAPVTENGPSMTAEVPAATQTASSSAEIVTVSTELVWKFFPLPSAYLSEPLATLYRFSITGGAVDKIIPSITYAITVADVSIKGFEIYAFSDEFFSAPALLNSKAAKRNRVGRYVGYVNPESKTVTILLDQGLTTELTIPAGETYYFELRGTVVGKNKGAFVTVAVEGLPEIKLE